MSPDHTAAELAWPVRLVSSAGAIGTIRPSPSMSRKTVASKKASGRFIVTSEGVISPLAGTEGQIIGAVKSNSDTRVCGLAASELAPLPAARRQCEVPADN